METCDVIIVGSGVAGLTTARHLADVYGITNTILVEAADYVGGCVCVRACGSACAVHVAPTHALRFRAGVLNKTVRS